MATDDRIGYAWRPIEPPPDPAALAVDEMRAFTRLWNRQRDRLKDSKALARFQERMNRWWSIETGIIERIYDISEGATRLLIEHGFVASLVAHGESNIDPDLLVEILGDHRQALDMVMDVVGGTRRLTTGWIKELHALTTRNQRTATGVTTSGHHIEVPLLRGEYKRLPNSPVRPDGLVHEYCPPEQVASEMDQLVEIYHAMPAEYPEVRAAWLHHAFTQIHPFQDGNGRVARALASVDFIKSGLFPLVVPRSERDPYLSALGQADAGNLGPLVEFFSKAMQRILTRAISEAENAVGEVESLEAALSAAMAKLASRTSTRRDQLAVMTERIGRYAGIARDELARVGESIRQRAPSLKVTASGGHHAQRNWFRAQLLALGDKYDHWVDLREPRVWARLQIKDGGITDIVVVLHFIGNPSPGTSVAVIFLDHRDPGERFGASPLVDLGIEPLLLAPDEDEHAQRARFQKWLDEAAVHAIAQWTRFL